MKTNLFMVLLLAATLCFYKCTTEYVYVITDENAVASSDELDPDNSDDNSGDDSEVDIDDDNGDDTDDDGDFDDDGYFSESGDGTRENPYTVSQALNMLNSGTYDPDKGYYVKGVVARVTGGCWAVEGHYNIHYYISEDGNYTEETCLFVDEGFGLGGGYFSSLEDLSVGDKVVVYGKLTIDVSNGDRREMVHGKLYYWNGGFGDLDDDEYFIEYGDGSREDPYAVSQVFEITDAGTYDPDKGYYVKGIVSCLNERMTEHYDGGWRISYYISEAGDSWAKTNLGVNYGYGLGGDLFSSEDALSPLDQVIVYGRLSLSNYGYPIMVGGKLCYWNGEEMDVDESFDEDEGDEEDDDQSDEDDGYYEEPGLGSIENPYTVTQATELIGCGSYIFMKTYFVKGIVSTISAWNGNSGCMSYYISETGDNNATRVFINNGYGLGGEKITSFGYLSEGDKVVVYGNLSISDDGIPEVINGSLYYLNGRVAEDINLGDNGDEDVCQYMTDSGFINYCIENFDMNGNGKVSFAEAEEVITINCSTASDFTGIEYFPNLESFTSYSAKHLDPSGNKMLSSIKLSDFIISRYYSYEAAPIETLDLSHNTNLTVIDDNAFAYCTSLSSISLPEGLTSIGNYAFHYCTSLTSVPLPEELTSICSCAFDGCKSLTDIVFPEKLASIGGGAFEGCNKLTSVALPESLTSLGSGAFSNCSNLTGVSFPKNLTSIGPHVFFQCYSLTSVSLPESLTSIGQLAFYYCKKLSSISLPEGLTSIGDEAFNNCIVLANIEFPKSLTSIGYGAFENCYKFTSVSLPENLASLGHTAFRGCYSLTYVSLPEGLTSLGSYTFEGCSSLPYISLPKSLTSIGSYAFHSCTSLTDISFPENLESIGQFAFGWCTGLPAISLPESLTTISSRAFYCNYKLASVSMKNPNPPSIGASVFSYISNDATLYVPSESIEEYENSYLAQYFKQILPIE